MKIYRLCWLLLLPLFTFSQETNQLDKDGKRHGYWVQYFPDTKQPRYEGNFVHGKETGLFKFYCESCKDQPVVTKEFDDKGDRAEIKYYTIEGNLVNEGWMEGRLRVGTWTYYHKDSEAVMMVEHYKNDLLHGEKTVFYPNGIPAEKSFYNKGLKEGKNTFYAPVGTLLKELQYRAGLLDGPAKHYDADGKLIMEGSYKKDRKNGVWNYYENGELIDSKTFPEKKDKK